MKRLILLLAVLVPAVGHDAAAQLVQARFVTSAYGWQRSDTVGQTTNHLYGFQNAQVTVGHNNILFNTSMQWSNDFAGPLKNDPTLRLYNFSVKARDLFSMLDVQAGRFYVLAGAGYGLMDGGQATARLPFYPARVTAYYGILPPPGQVLKINETPGDNAMGGAQIIAQPLPEAQVSMSYAYKSIGQATYKGIRADSLFNPYTVELRPSARTEQILSADANITISGRGEAYLRGDYDVETEGMSRFNAFARVEVIDRLSVTGEYLQREPRVSYNSIFSVFAFSTLKELEGGLEYQLTPDWALVARYGNVSYGDENSDRFTLAANGRLISASLSRDNTYSGNISAASVMASYPLMENLVTPNLLLSYARYKLSESAPLEAAFSLAAGATVRPMPVLLIDGQVQWIQNKIYANDVRLFVRASYLLSHRLGLL